MRRSRPIARLLSRRRLGGGERRWPRRLGLAGGLALSLLLALLVWAYRVALPAGALDPRAVASLRLVGRDGTLLRELHSREDGGATWVPLAAVSPHLIQATLAAEDQRYFAHAGVDGWAMLRAALLNLARGRVVSGGSTLTMQLCRILDPAPRTLRAKAREALLARKLERRLTKEQILWLYLNRAPYGNRTFGVEAAARRYLDKPAAALSLAEAALLAALPRSPSGYDPYRHRGRLLRRQRYILSLMRAQGRITAAEHRRARREPIAWEAARRPFLAPHLVQQVARQAGALGATWARTTLDPELQARTEAAVRATVERLRPSGVSNAAVLVLDNARLEVLAYVGSADFWSERDGGQNDGTLARRQPGSTIKPFTYALALEQGQTPASLLRDLPAHFATERGDYAPRNYDDTFHGPVRLRVALASSYNVPAIHTADFVGVDRLLSRLRAVGLRSLTRSARYYGLGLTLGNGEVTLQELVTAFAVLARGGTHLPLRFLLEARRPTGEALPLPAAEPRRIFDRRVAYLISHILADPMARLAAFGRRTPLEVGFPAAVKTGTSKDYRDNWTVGYTSLVTVGVWVGNFSGESMHNVSGISGAGPLWAEVITAAMRERTAPFTRPSGIVEREICPLSGALAGPHCDGPIAELFVAGDEPRQHCAMHQELALDRQSGLLAGPACAADTVERQRFVVYPPVYRAWAASRGLPAPPTESSPRCPLAPPAEGARVSVRFPLPGDRFFVDPDLRRPHQRLPLEATVVGTPREVRWLVDGRTVARAPYPYTAAWPLREGAHTIEAVLPDGQRSRPVAITVR